MTGIVIYLIPAILWFFEDLSGAALMFLYTIESIITVVFAIVCVLILAPKNEYPKQGNYSKKSDLIKTFLMISVGFMVVCLIFVSVFTFLVLKLKIEFSELVYALSLIIGFQIVEFISNLFLMRPMTLKKSEFFLSDSLGGIAVIFFSVFIGFFLAMFHEPWFVYPFLAFNAIIVIGMPIQYFWKEKKSVSILKEMKITSVKKINGKSSKIEIG